MPLVEEVDRVHRKVANNSLSRTRLSNNRSVMPLDVLQCSVIRLEEDVEIFRVCVTSVLALVSTNSSF